MTIKTSDSLPVVPDDREVRKTNELISRPLVRGHFSLLARKVFNAMLFHAQDQKQPGRNAPGESDAYKRMFWVPLTDIGRDAKFDSGDTAMLKEVARQLMDIQVENESDTEWTADHIVESVKIVNPAGLRKRGGRLWLGYRFPDEVMHLVMDPNRYTRLPLYYLTLLQSQASAALYEVAKESAWKTSGLTARAPWEDWQAILEGRPKAELTGWKSEYKFFKNRVLKRAILEVNTMTDITVELIEYKEGRKAGDIQFRALKKEQGQLQFDPPPIIDSSLVDAMVSFGIQRRDAEDLMASHDAGLLRTTIEHVHSRAANKNLPPLESTAAYFRAALKGRFVESEKPRALPRARTTASIQEEAPVDAAVIEAREQILAQFQNAPDDERSATLESFAMANPAMRAMIKRNPTGKAVLKALAGWLLSKGATP